MKFHLFSLIVALFLCATYAQDKPNIIFILADDLGYGDLSCYGQKKITTPNIDRIANMGMRFTRHYSGSTVCAPSRCSLMTGLSTGKTYIRGNRGSGYNADGDLDMPQDTLILPKALKEAGYVTGLYGKWGLGATESPSAPLKMGFDKFFGFVGQRMAHYYYPPYLWDGDKKYPLPENENNAKKTNSAILIQEKAMEFVKENAKSKKPFFLYYATTIPHAEMQAPDSEMRKFIGKFGEEKPFIQSNPKSTYNSQPNPKAAFAAMMGILDKNVGEILDFLEKEGLMENTIIFFTSDNGCHKEGGHDPLYWNSSGGLRGGKRDLYEGGIRTPMLICWKGKIAPASDTNHISAFWDIFPTISDIISCAKPKDTDGLSFKPLLFGQNSDTPKHDYLYWEFHEQGGKTAIIKDNFKLIKFNAKNEDKIYYELFDLSKDPSENNDISKSSPEILSKLKPVLNSARTPSPVEAFNF